MVNKRESEETEAVELVQTEVVEVSSPADGTPADARAQQLAANPDEMNRSRYARSTLLRRDKTRGEIELDDIHSMLNRQWVLLLTISFLVLINSTMTYLMLFTDVFQK